MSRERTSSRTWAERTTSPTGRTSSLSPVQLEDATASSEDADWKQIQKRVFTRWCNERLKVIKVDITELPGDFQDGVKLINLVQVLSKKMVGRYSKKPRIYAQKMENVDLALSLLTKKENIKLVNIGSGDIVGGDLKLTLGLVWTLILHYQISVGFGIDEKQRGSMSAKQVLMEFVQDFMPHQKVSNFTTDWNDGRLVAALVDGKAPGLCPEAYTMTPDTPLENATHAMTLAKDWLGVPMVLLPEDIVNPRVDSLSVITYLSQFSEAKLQEGAPIKEGGDPSKVKAYGDGLKSEGLSVSDKQTEFFVDVSEAKPFGALHITITAPNNMEVRSEVTFKDDIYTCRYTPGEEGKYVISINWWGKPIRDSPFTVNVGSRRGSLPRQSVRHSSLSPTLLVYGAGIEGKGVRAMEPAQFWVEGVASGTLQLKLIGPNGQLGSNYVTIQAIGKGHYSVLYFPPISGTYKLVLCVSGKDIAQSPYSVNVEPAATELVGWARGPGVEGTNIEVGKYTWFYVFSPTGSNRDVTVTIEGPKGPVTFNHERAIESVFKYSYMPKQKGEYKITIVIGPRGKTAKAIMLHYMVIVPSSAAAGTCKVWGPGISPRGVQVRQKALVHVQPPKTSEETVEFSISGEDGDIPFSETENDGVYSYTYIPPVIGTYRIEILWQGKPLPKSPYSVYVTDISQVTVSGYGVDGSPVPVGKTVTFTIDAKKAGRGQLACQVLAVEGNANAAPLSPKVTGKKDGTYEVTLGPLNDVCQQALSFTFDNLPISQNPIKINAVNASKVKVYGRGIQDGNTAQRATFFMIDTNEAGTGNIEAEINGPAPTPLTITPSDTEENTFKCEYTPPVPGDYEASIKFGGLATQGTPHKFKVVPAGETSSVAVYGPALESSLTVGTQADFFVNVGDQIGSNVDVNVESPYGPVKVKREPLKEAAVTKYSFPVYQPGPYTLGVAIDGKPADGSPFETDSVFPANSPKVSISGRGLEEAFVNEWAEFELDYHREGAGSLDVSVNGPAAAETKIEGGKPGKVTVKYHPIIKGDYKINVRFDNQAIPGSPFPVTAVSRDGTEEATDQATEVIKLEATGVRLGSDFTYTIDTSKITVPVTLTGKVLGPFQNVPTELKSQSITNKSFAKIAHGLSVIEPKISEKDKIYTVGFTPSKVGIYIVYIFFGDNLVNGMPYEVNVCDPALIELTGRGIGDKQNENSLIGDPLTWEADCSKAGPGTINGYVGGPPNCSKTFDIVPSLNKPDHYSITYTPSEPGAYQFLFAYSGFDLPTKPTLMVSDPSKAQMEDKGIKFCLVGEKVSFPVDLSAAGAGRLQASLEGPVEIPIDYSKKPDNTCVFGFTPTQAGKYSLNVSFGSKPLSDKPMEVMALDPAKLTVSGAGLTGIGAQVNQPASIYIDCTESGVAPLAVSLKTPEGQVSSLDLTPNNENGTILETSYTPTVTGYHEVSIEYAGKPVHGSPFKASISNPSAVRMTSTLGVLYTEPGKTCKLDFFTEGAGPGVLSAVLESVTGDSEPIEAVITSLPDQPGHYEVSFPVPEEPGAYKGTVWYNGVPVCSDIDIVGGKPLECDVEGPGINRKVAMKRPTFFTVQPKEKVPIETSFEAIVLAPDESSLPVNITHDGSTYQVDYEPEVTGDHSIDVKFDRAPVSGSPYKTTCVDVSQLALKPVTADAVKLGEPVCLSADLSTATDGEYNVAVEGPETCTVIPKEEADGMYTFSFTPEKAGVYSVIGTYDGLPVNEEPLQVAVTDSSSVAVYGSGVTGRGIRPGKSATVNVDLSKSGVAAVEGKVSTPAGETLPLHFKPLEDDSNVLSANYTPNIPGDYELALTFDGEEVPNSPFTAHIVSPDDLKIDGDGATDAGVGCENILDLFLPKVDPEEVTMVWMTPDHQEMPLNYEVEKVDDDHCRVKYTPDEEGVFEANVCYAGNPLFEAPWPVTVGDSGKAKVSGPAIEQEKLQAGLETYITVDTTEAGSGKPKVSLTAPNNEDIETEISQTSPGVYDVKFTPTTGGVNELTVKSCGQQVSSSPYQLQVFDPSAVKCTPSDSVNFKLGESVSIEYDISKAGPGQFQLNMTGPEDCQIVPTQNEQGVINVTFTPTTPGVYRAFATFQDVPCQEEPLKISIFDLEQIDISGAGATGKKARVGQPVEIVIDTSKSGPAPVAAVLSTPSGEKETLQFLPKDDDPNLLVAWYTPETSGYYTLAFTVEDEPLYQEPLRAYVVNPAEFQVIQDEIRPLHAVLNQVNTLDLFKETWIEEETQFGILLEDETGDESIIECKTIRLDEQHVRLEYLPELETAQFVTVCYNEVPLSEKMGVLKIDISECKIEGLLNAVPINLETSFKVNTSSINIDTKYKVSVIITQEEDSAQLEAQVTESEDEEGLYIISYTPKVIGRLSIVIKYGNMTIGGEPFTVYAVDPSLVVCTGLADADVLIGNDIVFVVDTAKAGFGGELKAELEEGPEGSTVSCDMVDDGRYTGVLSSTRMGTCKVRMTYAGENVPGSMFVCNFKRPEADATKCTVSDLQVPGHFTVECCDAGGYGMLEVAVYGAHVPVKYVTVEHIGDFKFSISYDIPNSVETTISVKWHGEHLQGSPFKVVFNK